MRSSKTRRQERTFKLNSKRNVRLEEKKTLKNKAIRTALRHTITKFMDNAESKDLVALESSISGAYKTLDQAWSKGVYKRNTISRYKSRLAKTLAKVKEELKN